MREMKGNQSSSQPLLQPPEDTPFSASRSGDPHGASVVRAELLGSCVDPKVSSIRGQQPPLGSGWSLGPSVGKASKDSSRVLPETLLCSVFFFFLNQGAGLIKGQEVSLLY